MVATAIAAVLAFARAATASVPLDALQPAFQAGDTAAMLPPGPDAVGFRVITAFDSTRPLHDAPRPLQLSVWYPATRSNASPLSYADYVGLSAAEGGTPVARDSSAKVVAAYRRFLTSNGVTDSTVIAWFDRPMSAVRDAAERAGRFPALLIAQGNDQSAHDQAFLAEYLASHGYVVMTMPSVTRISGPIASEDVIGARVEEQAADLAFATQHLIASPDVDARRLGVLGHSFGARGALLYAMHNPAVRAVVSLDGGIGTATGRESFMRAPGFQSARFRTPVLHIYEELDAFMQPDLTVLRALTEAPRWTVRTTGLHHIHFSTLGYAAARWPDVATATHAEAQVGSAYRAVTRLTLAFLDTYVAGRRRPFSAQKM